MARPSVAKPSVRPSAAPPSVAKPSAKPQIRRLRDSRVREFFFALADASGRFERGLSKPRSWVFATSGTLVGLFAPISDGVRGTADVPSHTFTVLTSALLCSLIAWLLVAPLVDSMSEGASLRELFARFVQLPRRALTRFREHRAEVRQRSYAERLAASVMDLGAGSFVILAAVCWVSLMGALTGLYSPAAFDVLRLLCGLVLVLSAVVRVALRVRERQQFDF
jgi:hypothetical protein